MTNCFQLISLAITIYTRIAAFPLLIYLGLHLRDVQEPSHEWGAALTEDLLSHKFRRFLTVDKKEFVAIRAAFDVFDADPVPPQTTRENRGTHIDG